MSTELHDRARELEQQSAEIRGELDEIYAQLAGDEADSFMARMADRFRDEVRHRGRPAVTDPALRIAVRALQVLAVRSRCLTSRIAANLALKAVAGAGRLETDEHGLPEPVVLAPNERPDLPNHMSLWSD